MAIDVNAIVDKFILVAQDGVGSLLSQTAHPTDPKGSVIPERSNHTNPSYPFITIDILDIRDEDAWITHREVNQDDYLEYSTHKQVSIYYRCYGEGSIQIVNQLQGFFRLERVRDDIRAVLEGSIVNTQIIDSLPVQLVDEFIESSTMGVTFNIVDTFVDDSTGIIDNVNGTGKLLVYEEDPDPLDMIIIVPE